MPGGVIKKLVKDRGFGFISQDQGDLFFHCTAVAGANFEELREGQHVNYDVEQGRRGPQAINVTPE
jgi:CspA family cold shock protein